MLCGQTGRPGTGLHPLRGQNNVQGASDAGLIPMVFPDYHAVGDPAYRGWLEALWGVDALDPQPGLTVVEIMHAMNAGTVRGMYIMGENPAMSDPDTAHARSALARLEHLVVQDIFLTETATFADVVLPASAWPEKAGTVTNTNRQVQMGRPALPLPGEARADWWIIQEMAKGLGLDWRYSGPEAVFAEMKQAMPSLDHITWDRLEHEGAVTYPCPDDRPPGPGRRLRRAFPDRIGPRQAGAGQGHRSGRDARRRLPHGADHRPRARALAHRGHDPPRQHARRARARGLRRLERPRHGSARHRTRRPRAGHHQAGRRSS